jgi:hypothetical protein
MFLQKFNCIRYPFVQNVETFNAKLFFYSLQHNRHYTKLWKILFQVCKKMNFLLNCQLFYLHQSKLWGKHTYKNSRICKHHIFIIFPWWNMVEKTSYTNAIMNSNMVMFVSTQMFRFEILLFVTKSPSGHNVYQVQIQKKF